ncbi:MAG: transcriptional repressor LexA [Firmicutes bacterium]|jgi:repressor LexA|nr:transcriptional repressor LexA [Bacillota bacterium]MDH7496528.1 transcriptional repressor LexA [Bacillota bacterium]
MPRKKSLSISHRQQQILDFITKQTDLHGYPPSVREIGHAVGLRSTSTVHGHLSQLEKKGYIRRDPTKPRAIEVLPGSGGIRRGAAHAVPVVGRVTAGQPILAVENIEDYFPLPKDFGEQGRLFMLKVRGDSMIEAGILDGDLVIVRQQDTADNGDIVVALLEDEATVKRFFREPGRIRLQPENRFMDPIMVRDVVILGKVVGLVRRLH